jgi:hypothetical protein
MMLLVWPPVFALSGVIEKDAIGGHLALLAFVLALPQRERPLAAGAWVAAFACGTLAMLLRYQFGLILPVITLLLWWEDRRYPQGAMTRTIASTVGTGATFAVVMVAVYALFTHTGDSDMRLSLRKMMIYDIAGVVMENPAATLPWFSQAGVNTAQLKAEMRRDYSPIRVDTMWQVDGAGDLVSVQHGVFARLRSISDHLVWRQWLSTSFGNADALLDHRIKTFARVLGFGDIYDCRPIRSGISWIPDGPAAYVHAKAYRAPISASILESRYFPVGIFFRAWMYVLACVLLLGMRRIGLPREAMLLSGFGLAYEASFFVLPQACEVRYSYPVMLAAIFAAAILAFTAGRDRYLSE